MATVKTHAGTGSWGSNPGAGVSISVVNQLGIATGASIVVVDRASSFYIQENESLSVQANVANLLNTVISYEIIQ
mgnify:FL=1